MAESPLDSPTGPQEETADDSETVRAPGKTRKERIHGKSQDRIRQDILEDRSIDDAIKESIRLHGA